MADGINNAADGKNIANGPVLAVDPIVVMEDGMAAPTVMANGTVDGGSLKNGDLTADPKRRRRTVSVAFALRASVVYAVTTSLALWSVAGRPRSVVWVFSIAATTYLALWTVILAETMRARRTALFSTSYIALVAAAVAHLSSRVGMAVMHLDTAYAAGLCGHALAEHMRLIGADESAAAVPMPSSLSEEELRRDGENRNSMSFFAAVVSVACAACAKCALWLTEDTFWLVIETSFLVDLSLYCWTCILALEILHGVIVQSMHMTSIYLIGPPSLCLLDISASYFLGKAIGTLVYSLGMIGMAGLFGYCLGVYDHYKHLVSLEEDGSNDDMVDEKRRSGHEPVRV